MDPYSQQGHSRCPFNSYFNSVINKNEGSPISEDEQEFEDGETIPDEEYQHKLKNQQRGILKSWPNNINLMADPSKIKVESDGPNINIKVPRKSYSSHEEKKYFFNKIKIKQKTELCKNWSLYSDCYFKESCSFAHGEKELRQSQATEKYKTKFCKMFKENFFCNYGNRCIYLHVIKQTRLFKYVHLLKRFAEEFNSEFTKPESECQDILKILQLITNKKHVVV